MNQKKYLSLVIPLAILGLANFCFVDEVFAAFPSVATQDHLGPDYTFPTSAFVEGDIISNGGGNIIKKGIQYGLTETPTWDVNLTGDWWPGTGLFTFKLWNLEPETTYHYRAYAANSTGTSYGAWKNFTAKPTPPSPGYTTSGTLISTNLLAGRIVQKIDYFGYDASIPANTSLKAQFSQDNSNWYSSTGSTTTWDILSDGNYLATSSAINLSVLNWSGPYFYYKVKFETLNTSTTPVLKEVKVYYTPGAPPSVTTQDPLGTDYTFPTSAFIEGDITNNGGAHITKKGIQYGLSETPTWDVNITGDWWPGTGLFTFKLWNLNSGTTYYYRAYAINSLGTGYGVWKNFSTKPALPFPGYTTSGTLVSNNLLAGKTIDHIDAFGYQSSIPVSTTLKAQFSQDNTNWYSANHELNVWTELSHGNYLDHSNSLPLSDFSAEPHFYYRIKFETTNTSTTPVLYEVRVFFNSPPNVFDWAWSENIGWISFNCKSKVDTNGDGIGDQPLKVCEAGVNKNKVCNSGFSGAVSCPGANCVDACNIVDYGVNLKPSTLVFSGYAWAENIGWITFNESELSGCPTVPCRAWLDSSYKMYGWARALAASSTDSTKTGGWDGWIKLSDAAAPAYGVTFNTATNEFEGFAWGSDVMGWLSFNDNYNGFPGPIDYQVVYTPPPALTALYIDNFANTVCGYTSGARVRFNWNFLSPGDTQSAYQIQIDNNSNFSSPEVDSCSPAPGTCSPVHDSNSFISSPPNLLSWATTYYWRVRAWNSLNAMSSCGNPAGWCYPPSPSGSPTPAPGISTSTPAHSYPYVKFAPKPQTPSVKEITTFIQDDIAVARSLCYNGGEHLCQNDANATYEWDFSYESIFIPEEDFQGNATTSYAAAGPYTVGLRISDDSLTPVGQCTAFSSLKVGIPPPEWREIPPF